MAEPRTLQTETVATAGSQPTSDAAIEAQVLVEDVSIDGMCGVY